MDSQDNPTLDRRQGGYGGLAIDRIAPADGGVEVEWSLSGPLAGEDAHFVLDVREIAQVRVMGVHTRFLHTAPAAARSLRVGGLSNGIDYVVTVSAIRGNVEAARSRPRLFRPGAFPGVVVAYLHPEDYTFDSSGRSTASPSLLRLPNGRLLASHDIYWARGGQNITHIYRSDDDGASWHYQSQLVPCFWGKMFWHRDALHMLGVRTEYGDLLVYRSEDEGRTFGPPTVILEGTGLRDKPGPHRAPMPIVTHAGRIWTALEFGTWEIATKHDSAVVSAPLDADLTDARSWTVSGFTRYDPAWPGAIVGGSPGFLEGNVVVTPDGGLVNILRYHTIGGEPDYGKAVVLRIDPDDPSAACAFDRIIEFPGNMSKFEILRDPKTGLYIALVNRVSVPWVGQRNILSLSVSKDAMRWRVVRDLINYQDRGWPEGHKLVGFQYPDMMIDGEDLLYLSRTALNGAHNFHDANTITFHRLEGFRAIIDAREV